MTPATETAIESIVSAVVGAVPVPIPGASELARQAVHLAFRVASGEPLDDVLRTPAKRAEGVDIEALAKALDTASG